MRAKLIAIVMLTTASALLVAGVALLTNDLLVYRQSWASDVATEASIMATATAPALAFDDREAAQRNLAALNARPEMRAAALYLPSGALIAQYVREGEPPPPSTAPVSHAHVEISGERVEIAHRIERNAEWLGTLYLRAHYDVAGRVRTYLAIFGLVMALGMAAALALSSALQRTITAPLGAMTRVARKIIEERDYSLRVEKRTDDEVGVVVDAFNNLLHEVQTATRALESSNASLREEVTERKAAERSLRQSEKLYRAIGESIDFGVWVCDREGRNIYASESFLRLTGMTQQECAEFGWGKVLHPDDLEPTLAAWRECVRSGVPWYREHRILGVDGRYHPVLAQGVPIPADDGTVTGWAGINLDIARLKQTEDALREADRRKDVFLATLAHELRNPLAPIRNATAVLERDNAGPQQKLWAREVITRQVQHMALLLDDLLDISRITRGRLELKRDFVALDQLIAAALETARPLIEARGHTLQIELPEAPIGLNVDPLRLSQALSNLLTNAAKYTDPGGQISILASTSDEGLVLCVKDTGIGLSPAALTRVFEMFSQDESAIGRSQGGLGIGLALVKGLVTLHGGTVEARSDGPHRGSTFIIRLTKASIVGHDELLAQTAARPLTEGPRCRVLIVDDNRDAADSLAMVLSASGFPTLVAHSGLEGLDTAKRERPEAFILDIGMPDISGYEMAARIRRQNWRPRPLILAVTGWGQQEDKDRAHAAGFDEHFTKPVDVPSLERRLALFSAQLGEARRA